MATMQFTAVTTSLAQTMVSAPGLQEKVAMQGLCLSEIPIYLGVLTYGQFMVKTNITLLGCGSRK